MAGPDTTSIDWRVYDSLDRFSLFNAACLWAEIDLDQEFCSGQQQKVQAVLAMLRPTVSEEIKTRLMFANPGKIPSSEDVFCGLRAPFRAKDNEVVYRHELENIAKKLKTKPQFLFPEERNLNPQVSDSKKGSGVSKNYCLRLIAALLIDKGYEPPFGPPDARGNAGELEKLVENAMEREDWKPRIDVIRKILTEIDKLDLSPKERKSAELKKSTTVSSSKRKTL